MNVYDFDGTIYPSNCTVDFAIWCILRHPGLLFTYVPRMLVSALGYKLGKVPAYKFIRVLMSYLTKVPDFDRQVEAFWDKHEKKISEWYLRQKDRSDLIISASPECILRPLSDRMGVQIMGTLYDRETGVLYGNLMLAQSKARFIIDMGMPVISNFYSDALSDTPIALCAENAYLVTKHATTPVPWPKLTPEVMKKVRKDINTGWKYIDD